MIIPETLQQKNLLGDERTRTNGRNVSKCGDLPAGHNGVLCNALTCTKRPLQEKIELPEQVSVTRLWCSAFVAVCYAGRPIECVQQLQQKPTISNWGVQTIRQERTLCQNHKNLLQLGPDLLLAQLRWLEQNIPSDLLVCPMFACHTGFFFGWPSPTIISLQAG